MTDTTEIFIEEDYTDMIEAEGKLIHILRQYGHIKFDDHSLSKKELKSYVTSVQKLLQKEGFFAPFYADYDIIRYEIVN